MSDEKTLFYNSNEANRVYRITDKACAEHGCDAVQCSLIAEQVAREVGAAEARSFQGQLWKLVKDNILKGAGIAMVLAAGAVATWLGLK